ncbi:conserved hypothetical protein [Neisseria gonorrhoeae DGI2]|uniref:Uncharacterized protein n=1 Tax=Neisseria gonorrhoeae (strain NCCP11945) TaxID=521006 RepID=B4RQ75_NEIG2|nr:Hypothetical protein NGK_0189 [Neisseria gonorrhoeae NCCP11945]EFE03418.1 conserved hypothetical protein [Neisseria gonorrhoeae DGI2]
MPSEHLSDGIFAYRCLRRVCRGFNTSIHKSLICQQIKK